MAAAEHAWDLADDSSGADETTDLTPAQQWLRRSRLAVPTVSLLGLWGWAGDVAASTGTSWTARELDVLCALAGSGVHVLRTATVRAPAGATREVDAALLGALPDLDVPA